MIHALERLWKITDTIPAEVEGGDGNGGGIPDNVSVSSNASTSTVTASHLTFNRSFCWIRHAMHFFMSNLFYFMQIDVIDTEYASFCENMNSDQSDFATIARLHRTFVANMVKHCMIENSIIQEGIEHILHLCCRFLSICTLLLKEDSLGDKNFPVGVVVPPEEFDALYTEFIAQVGYLVHMIKKVESGMVVYVYILHGLVFNMFAV